MSFPGFLYEFNNSPISVAFPSYLNLTLTHITSPTQLYWPSQAPYEPTPFSSNMVISSNDNSGNIITLPDATYASTAQSSIIWNNSGTDAILNNFSGGYIGTITAASDLSYYLVLTSNSTVAGSWQLIPFGTASLAPIDVQNLVDTQDNNTTDAITTMEGGLAAVMDTEVDNPSTFLKVNTKVNTINSDTLNYDQNQGDRGTLLVVEGSSNLDYNLMSASYAGNGFIFSINNATSTGDITLNVASMSGDTIDQPILAPSNSSSYISDGANNWRSLGYGFTTIPLDFVDVTISLASGSQGTPPLNFVANTSAGLFYDTTDVPARPSLQIVQNGFVLGQFQQDSTTYPTGLTTILGSTFQNSNVNLISSSLVATATTVTIQTGSIFNSTTATLFGSSFSTSLVSLNATTINATATTANIDTTGAIDLVSSAGSISLEAFGTIDLTSTDGNINLTSDTNMNINSGAIVSIIATDDITITSSTADIDITSTAGNINLAANDDITITSASSAVELSGDTSITLTAPFINNVATLLQQEGISIYSLARAYA